MVVRNGLTGRDTIVLKDVEAIGLEHSYLGWVRRFLKYVSQTGGNAPMPENVKAFLSHLAVHRKVASSTGSCSS